MNKLTQTTFHLTMMVIWGKHCNG